MIFYNTGRTGSGKTQYAIFLAHIQWLGGKDIWSNTPLFFTTFNCGSGGQNIVDNPEYFTIFEKIGLIIRYIFVFKLFKKDFYINKRGRINYIDTIDETFHIEGSCILFDEGQTIFRAYDWESIPRMFLHKLEQNRKDGNDMITTAQRPNAVNINYRYLVQDWNHFETIIDFFKMHVFRHKVKDIDAMDENLKESEIPTVKMKGLLGFKIIGWWSKIFTLYDSYFNIGYEPLQHYAISIGNNKVNLHLESGMTISKFLTNINKYQKLIEYGNQ